MQPMRLFYVRRPVKLTLPHKVRQLEAPNEEQLASGQIPTNRLYCGNVVWEVLMAQKQLPKSEVVQISDSALPEGLLPRRILDFHEAGAWFKAFEPGKAKVRIALLNGFGTMLGDTALGCGALMAADPLLRELPFQVEYHAYASWNARPGVETLLKSCPRIAAVQSYSPTLDQLRQYDAYVDFSSLLSLPGYGTQYFIDFYLRHLGVNPEAVPSALKKPWFEFDAGLLQHVPTVLPVSSRPTLLLHPHASTPLRSMPSPFVRRLLDDLVAHTDYRVVLVVNPGFALSAWGDRVLDLSAWSAKSLQHMGAIVQAVDAVVSVDTLVIHVAHAAGKPSLDILTASEPVQSVPPEGPLKGLVIPGAQALPGWMTHKAQGDWADMQAAYEQAWMALNGDVVINALKGH